MSGRQNRPAMVDPRNTIQAATDRQLGISTPVALEDRIAELERQIAAQNQTIARLLRQTIREEPIGFVTPQVLTTRSVKGAVTATNVTSTTGTTITNSNLPALLIGVPYLVFAESDMDMNAPAGQSIIACVRIGSSGATIDGTRTATVGGERRGTAWDAQIIIGTGASVNIAARARVTGGTGTVNDCISFGWAIPLGAMVQV